VIWSIFIELWQTLFIYFTCKDLSFCSFLKLIFFFFALYLPSGFSKLSYGFLLRLQLTSTITLSSTFSRSPYLLLPQELSRLFGFLLIFTELYISEIGFSQLTKKSRLAGYSHMHQTFCGLKLECLSMDG